jgi:cytochrome P450
MSDSLLRDEAVTMLLAGHETTALLLTFCVMLVAGDPAVEARLREELGRLGSDRPTAAQLATLPYLDAVLRETLRLYPPAFAIGREALVDTEIGGHPIRRGAQVWAFQWATQRDARFFADPLAFRPERWLDAETARLPRFAYFPFGGGPRVCPGNHFALIEAKVVLALLLRERRFELVRRERPKLLPTATIRPLGGLPVRVLAARG